MTTARYRTSIYIDGFNFYYGQVKGTPYKWLDLEQLFQKLLGPENHITRIKYFTARVQSTPNDPHVGDRQDAYLRALRSMSSIFEPIYGHFLRHDTWMENATPPPPRVKVWKTEEKGSDVNLALHVLNDAWLNKYDCAVIVSNDSDLAESLRLVKQQHKKIIGLVTPGAPGRRTSRQLSKHANFQKIIRTGVMQSSQLPDQIPGTKIYKPTFW